MDGVRLAFCQLLLSASSGARGLCDIGSDCKQCRLMQSWIHSVTTQGWEARWECSECVRVAALEEKHRKRSVGGEPLLVLPGFYQSIDAASGILGCESCGWSETFLLQLVLRKKT